MTAVRIRNPAHVMMKDQRSKGPISPHPGADAEIVRSEQHGQVEKVEKRELGIDEPHNCADKGQDDQHKDALEIVDQILLERFHGLVDFLSRLSTGTERYWLACGAARLALQSRRRLR